MKDGFKIFSHVEYAKRPIPLWIKFILFFIPEQKAIDGDWVCRFKVLNGIYYITSCKNEALT